MRTMILPAVVASLALASAALAQPPAGAQVKEGPEGTAVQPVVIPASDLKWTDLDPKGAPGVKIAPLWGDHTTGAFGAFFRLPAGFTVPLHRHTHDMQVVFVSGTYIQSPEGRPEFRLGPGSYFMQPGGDYRHVTSCGKDADCVFYVQSDGAFDLEVVKTGTSPDKDR